MTFSLTVFWKIPPATKEREGDNSRLIIYI